MKNRLTNYNFWISLVSAALLIVQALGIEFDIAYINEIATAVLGLLVVIGIISDPTKSSTKQQITSTETEKTETNNKVTPCGEENEIIDDNLKNDFEGVVNQISKDLETKFNELETLKQEIQKKLDNDSQFNINLINPEEKAEEFEIEIKTQENSENECNQNLDGEENIEDSTLSQNEDEIVSTSENTDEGNGQTTNLIDEVSTEVQLEDKKENEIANTTLESIEEVCQNEDVDINEQVVETNSTNIETNETEIEEPTSFPIVGE